MTKFEPATATFETVSCPICGSDANQDFLHVTDRFALREKSFYTLQKCTKCSHIFLNPRPVEAESGQFYNDPNYSPFFSTQKDMSLFERFYAFLRNYNNAWKRRKIMALTKRSGRILDIGCGTGEFLVKMRARGWDVNGIERDENAANFAKNQMKIPLLSRTLSEFKTPSSRFHVITMWHVLEHIYHPEEHIIQIYELLEKGGLLIIAVPNNESVDANFYKENWIAWDTPRHVQHFNLSSLRAICEGHKFKLLQTRNLPLDSLFNALMSEQLIAQRHPASGASKLYGLARAGFIGLHSLLKGSVTGRSQQPQGATLLTVWQK